MVPRAGGQFTRFRPREDRVRSSFRHADPSIAYGWFASDHVVVEGVHEVDRRLVSAKQNWLSSTDVGHRGKLIRICVVVPPAPQVRRLHPR
jgi:hypothetical protein